EWIELVGKVTALIVEGDGDIHIELMNTNGGPAKADAEIPAGQKWCSYRKIAFGWTEVEFPIVIKRTELRLPKHRMIRVCGKSFWRVSTHLPQQPETRFVGNAERMIQQVPLGKCIQ